VTPIVVDASVAVKWCVSEKYDIEAQVLLSGAFELQAPDLIIAEFGNIIWKKVAKHGGLADAEGRRYVADFAAPPLTLFASTDLLTEAYRLAVETTRTAYDCLYLALAQAQGCAMVTADERFYNALERTPYRDSIVWIGDLS